MPKKEDIEVLIKKWNWLLEDLSSAQYKRYKYSRIFNNTSRCENRHLKILLPLAYRVLRKTENINVSRSEKENQQIIQLEKSDIEVMDLDAYMSLLDAVSDMIVEKINENNIASIFRLRLEENDGSYKISVSY